MTCRLFFFKSSVTGLFQGFAINQNLQDLFELVIGLQVGTGGCAILSQVNKAFVDFVELRINSN